MVWIATIPLNGLFAACRLTGSVLQRSTSGNRGSERLWETGFHQQPSRTVRQGQDVRPPPNGTSLQVPYDQIIRCSNWTKVFELYKTRKVILAFKFLSKKRIGLGMYENRVLKEYYKTWSDSFDFMDCVCTYDGKTYGIQDGIRHTLSLQDFKMPFIKKNRGRPKKS